MNSDNYKYFISIPMIVITIIIIIFIYYNRKEKIIVNPGYIKCELILFGLLAVFFSLNFNQFTNYLSCSVKLLLQHSGVLLIYIIFFQYEITGGTIGMSKDELKNINNTNSSKKGNYFFLIQNAYENDNENGDGNGNGNENNNNKCNNENNINDDENINSKELQSIENLLNKKNMNRSKSNHVINNCNPINNININANNTDFNTDNMNGCKNLNKNSNSTHSSNNKLSKSLTVSTFSLFTDDKKLNSMNTKIEYIHLVHIESVLIYILTYIIMIIVVLLYIPKSNSIENNYIQEFDGKWRYKCSLEYINSIMNAVELTLIIYLLLKVFKTWNYICVFKCLKYIGLSSLIWVTLGPLVNVI